jgi:hypothetical protein
MTERTAKMIESRAGTWTCGVDRLNQGRVGLDWGCASQRGMLAGQRGEREDRSAAPLGSVGDWLAGPGDV